MLPDRGCSLALRIVPVDLEVTVFRGWGPTPVVEDRATDTGPERGEDDQPCWPFGGAVVQFADTGRVRVVDDDDVATQARLEHVLHRAVDPPLSMFAAVFTTPCMTTPGMVTPMGAVGPTTSLKWSTICAMTSATASGVGVRCRSAADHSPGRPLPDPPGALDAASSDVDAEGGRGVAGQAWFSLVDGPVWSGR